MPERADPQSDVFVYNFTVDWGDGETDTVTSFDDPDRIHEYAEEGEKTITIEGILPAWNFYAIPASSGKIIEVTDLGDVGWKNLSYAFYSCGNLTAVSGGNVSGVVNMSHMFSYISNSNIGTGLTLNISSWDTSKVTDMNSTFKESNIANPDVSRWDTSKVTDMSRMFSYTRFFTPDVSMWNTSRVENMREMFGSSSINPNISSWNTSSVTDMGLMFTNSIANPDMSGLNLSNVTNMGSMFESSGLSSANFSGLLINLAANNTNENINLGAGGIQYEVRARSAIATLQSRGWIIRHGGEVGTFIQP